MSKLIVEIFVFVDFDLQYTESDRPHGSLLEGRGLFVTEQLGGWGLILGGLHRRRGLNRVFAVQGEKQMLLVLIL